MSWSNLREDRVAAWIDLLVLVLSWIIAISVSVFLGWVLIRGFLLTTVE